MAFSSAITAKTVWGNKKVTFGTWDGTGVTGGAITTGLTKVQSMVLTPTGSAVTTNAAVINGTFPITGAVTIVHDSGVKGVWIAIGV